METRSILKVELPASTNNCYRAVEHGLSGVIDSHRPCPFAGSRKLQPSSTTRFSCPAAKGGAACGGHSPDNAVVPRIHLASFWPCHSTAYSVAPPHSFRTTGLGEAHTSICNWKRFFSPGDCGVQGDILVAPSDRDYLRACILSAVLRHNSRQLRRIHRHAGHCFFRVLVHSCWSIY